MVKKHQKPLSNRQLIMQVLVEIEDIRVYMDELDQKISKIDFANSIIALSEGRSNITIISPEPISDNSTGEKEG